jgi:hypothetical protein
MRCLLDTPVSDEPLSSTLTAAMAFTAPSTFTPFSFMRRGRLTTFRNRTAAYSPQVLWSIVTSCSALA